MERATLEELSADHAALLELLRVAFIVRDGRVYFKTHNGVPMETPQRVRRVWNRLPVELRNEVGE